MTLRMVNKIKLFKKKIVLGLDLDFILCPVKVYIFKQFFVNKMKYCNI